MVWALLVATMVAPVMFRPLLVLSESVDGLWTTGAGRMAGVGSNNGGGGRTSISVRGGGRDGEGEVEGGAAGRSKDGGSGSGAAIELGAVGRSHEDAYALNGGATSAVELLQAEDVLRPLPLPGDAGIGGRLEDRRMAAGTAIRSRGGGHDARAHDLGSPQDTEASFYDEGESVLSAGSEDSIEDDLVVNLDGGQQ